MTFSIGAVAMVLGWVGAASSMAAYYLVSSGRFAPDSLRYHALNMAACAMLAFACLATRSWPSMVTNLMFMAIGVHMTWKVRDRILVRAKRVLAGAGPRPVGAPQEAPAEALPIPVAAAVGVN
ncbi:hypothetical protein [Schaalia sp. 19OD2882]|uniref:CBU_0592 family membrane protein n=1 Tax=Schaalia sp. 19OD2882 TaxID=2794089 RepID=UPI0020A79D16|nr:hypothetical protein [Schaalia sp. 19OD2882]